MKKKDETPEVDYEEVHKTDLTDIVTEEPTKEPEKEEPVKEPEKEPEKEVEWDPAEFEAKINYRLEETAQKIIEAATGRKEPETEVDPELLSPWAKEKRTPKDYEEVADWALTKKGILDKRSEVEHEKEVEAQKIEQEKTTKAQTEQFNKYVDEQLDDLHNAGKIDKTNEEQRKELFKTMLDVNVARTKEGKPPIYSLKEIFYEHYKAPTKQPAGADAPVSPGRSGGEKDTKEIDYAKDVKGKSFFDILTGK